MTLRSLRADIAESLEVLAAVAPFKHVEMTMMRGAETLRYIEALDPEPDDAEVELISEAERLTEALELCQDFALQFMNKRLTAAKFRDAVLRTCEATL